MSTPSTAAQAAPPSAASAGMSDDDVEVLYAHGHSFFTMKQYPKALQFLVLAMLLRPKALHYMIAVGLTYSMLDEAGLALATFQLAVILHPSRPEPRVHLADCALMMGDTALAIDTARAALDCPRQGGLFEADLRQRAQVIVERGGQLMPVPVPVPLKAVAAERRMSS